MGKDSHLTSSSLATSAIGCLLAAGSEKTQDALLWAGVEGGDEAAKMFMRRGLLGPVIDQSLTSLPMAISGRANQPLPKEEDNDVRHVETLDDRAQGKGNNNNTNNNNNNNDSNNSNNGSNPSDHINAAAAAVVSDLSEGVVLREAFARRLVTTQQMITKQTKHQLFVTSVDRSNNNNNKNNNNGDNNNDDVTRRVE